MPEDEPPAEPAAAALGLTILAAGVTAYQELSSASPFAVPAFVSPE